MKALKRLSNVLQRTSIHTSKLNISPTAELVPKTSLRNLALIVSCSHSFPFPYNTKRLFERQRKVFQQFPRSEINLTFVQAVKLNEWLGGSINLKMRLSAFTKTHYFPNRFQNYKFPFNIKTSCNGVARERT